MDGINLGAAVSHHDNRRQTRNGTKRDRPAKETCTDLDGRLPRRALAALRSRSSYLA